MKNIIFLTTHMGGGVGKAISSFVEYVSKNVDEFKIKLILTEEPMKTNSLQNIEYIVTEDSEVIKEEIEQADLVVLNWWHSPKMAKVLNEFPNVKTRLVIWYHISGCSYPVIPAKLAKMANKNLFTSKYSYENKFWTDKERAEIVKKSEVVYGQGNFEGSKIVKKEKEGFTLGYIGTISYNKLHPDFVYYCKAVENMIDKIVMVADYKPDEKEAILSIARNLNIEDKFEFIGFTTDVASEYAKFDVMAYLLNHNHFGTTENVLLEAMYYGVPTITFNQNTEKHIFKHLETGILVNNITEFKNYFEYLYNNESERLRIANNAKEFFEEEYVYSKNANRFLENINDALKTEKQIFDFKQIFGVKPYEWFMACLGDEKEYFEKSININDDCVDKKIVEFYIENCDPILKGTSKSSIPHFLSYYEDDVLEYWNNIINKKIK